MARIRTIKPQFFLNEELAELPAMVRLLFIGLWTQSDREGRLIDRPKRLKAEIFPYDNFDIEKGLTQLSDAGFILRYKVNVNVTDSVLAPEQPITELALIQVINFLKHQKIDRINEKDSEIPPPNSLDYNKSTDSLSIVQEGKGMEGNGKEWNRGGEKKSITSLEKSDLVVPFAKKFISQWGNWKEYKLKEFKLSFKSTQSEQAALNELVELAAGQEDLAIKIIHQSMAKGWKGFFELKNLQKNGESKPATGAAVDTRSALDAIDQHYAKARNPKS